MDVSSASSRAEDDPERQAVEEIKRARYISGKDVNDLVTTKHHVLSLYGPRTPVTVSESLLVTQGAKDGSSINANPGSEFAWYVYQRKLLVWRFNPENDDKNAACSIAIELLLPKSDLPLHANLVCVFKPRGFSSPCCLAVSPEGGIRFWEVLSPHSSWVDANANLGGEEVCSVHYVPPFGCLAVTTSGSLVLIKPTTVRNSTSVAVKHISGRQGWMSGISRRVEAIFFGAASHNVESSENKVKMVTIPGVRRGQIEWQVYLLVGLKLQMKVVRDENPASLVFEVDLEEMIMKQFSSRAECSDETELVVLDVRMSEGGLGILVASTEPRRYLLLEIPCRDETSPSSVYTLCDLCKRDIDVLERNSGKIPHLQFLLLPTTALIYNRRTIIGAPLDGGSQSRGDLLTIPGEGVIVGGLSHKGSPIFFSPTYAFVRVQPVEGAYYNILTSTGDRTFSKNQTSDKVALPEQKHMSSVKTAFLMYIRQNMKQCHYVIEKEFPKHTPEWTNSPLSLTLLRFSLDIIHNAPSKDPRWEHFNSGQKLSGIVSLHIETQLQEKIKAHDMFLNFVYDSLRGAIGKVTKKDKNVNVLHVIAEHNDKLVAAWKLCKLHDTHGTLIDSAIFKALDVLELTTHQNLTPKDIFYRYVSIVDVGLKCLIEECADVCSGDGTLNRKRQILVNTLMIVWEVTADVLNKQRNRHFELPAGLNWLNNYKGPKATYEYFKLLFEMVTGLIEKISFEEEEEFHNKVVSMLRDLVDVILHLQSTTQPPERYTALRSWYIDYFIYNKHYLYAKQLAIKFLDMKALVELTYILKETDNIPKYIDSYGDIGICEEIFRYLLKKNLKAELLNLKLPAAYKNKLETCLMKHPDIYWLYKLKEGESVKAAESLVSFASTYNKDVDICERMWSMAKLICKAEGITALDDQITKHLECITAQRYLSGYLEKLGRSSKAYNEVQIIQMLVSPQNTDVTESHFKKALDLLRFVEDDNTREKLRNDVWSKAVQMDKDGMLSLQVDSSVDNFANYLVFRLIHLIVSAEENDEDHIPPFENLNLSEDVDTSKRLIYLLRLGYEHITRTHSAMDADE